MFDQEKAYESGLEVLMGMKDACKPTQEQIGLAENLLKKLGYDDLYDVNELDEFEASNFIEELKDEWERKKCMKQK